MNIKLTKLSDCKFPTENNRIPIGKVAVGHFVRKPKVGECYLLGYLWTTSVVQELMEDNTFRTLNSIYKWETLYKKLPW